MATLTVQRPSLTGLNPTYTALAADGDDFANDGRTLLIVRNGSGSPVTITVTSPAECNQGHPHDIEVSVPAGADRVIGPFPTARFSRTVEFEASNEADMSAAVIG